MTGIQIILLAGIILVAVYFVTRVKKKIFDIIFLLLLIACAITFVLWPSLTNDIAHWLGVGRGADLITYISIIIFWFISLKLYARIRKLEQILTEITRNDALRNVKESTVSHQYDNKQ